jgi:hypothetical protein
MTILIGLFVAATIATIFSVLRIAAFRVDRPLEPRLFGQPYNSWREILTSDNYSSEGQRLLPWLAASFAVALASFLVLMWFVYG